jgi:hypothetical protein
MILKLMLILNYNVASNIGSGNETRANTNNCCSREQTLHDNLRGMEANNILLINKLWKTT